MLTSKFTAVCSLALGATFCTPPSFAADLVAASPTAASYRVVPKPVCHRGCRQLRVCDDIIVTHGEVSRVVAICYRAKY